MKFLARQALPLRGYDDENSNFSQLLKSRSEDFPDIQTWLDCNHYTYTSPEIQNEILQLMALSVLRNIAANIRTSDYFTIMADETTDISNREQLVVCIRWTDSDLEVHEDFIGLY